MSKILDRLDKECVDHLRKFHNAVLSKRPSLEYEKRWLEASLYEFVKEAWPYCGATRSFLDNWHIEAICNHLESNRFGVCPYLIINLPPRMSKSTLVCVMFPAWVWTTDPAAQFLFASYSREFARRDSIFCNELISSDWYKERWGSIVNLVRNVNNIDKFRLTAGGFRHTISVGSMMTGTGADFIIVDDPNSVSEADSLAKQETTNRWWTRTASTRINDPNLRRKIVVQQRIHENDLTGYILNSKTPGVTHLFLPMEYETSRICETKILVNGKVSPWKDKRTKENEILWPSLIDRPLLEQMKAELGSSYVVAGQYQQRPAPESGGIFNKKMFQWWCEPELPTCLYILQSWDTAFSGIDRTKISKDRITCYSACTTWGVFDDEYGVKQLILLHSWKGKVEYPELRTKAHELSSAVFDPSGKPPHRILVEAKANGLSLLQDLRRSGVMATKFDPTRYGNKVMRARLITHILEAERVWVPSVPPNFHRLRKDAHDFVEDCALFPNGLSNDSVDSMSQAIISLYKGGMISHPKDVKEDPMINFFNRQPGIYIR